MGEVVLRHEATKQGIDVEVDSAGTAAYHLGKDPDYRYTTIQQSIQMSKLLTNYSTLQDHFDMQKGEGF